MPILFVHGVAVRNRDSWPSIRAFLRHFVAPAISEDPQSVLLLAPYWGDLGVQLAWQGASRPRTPLRGQGPEAAPVRLEQAQMLAALPATLNSLPADASVVRQVGTLVASGPAEARRQGPGLLPSSLAPDELSDLVATAACAAIADIDACAQLAIAADELARDPRLPRRLAAASTMEQQVAVLQQLIQVRSAEQPALVGMGAPGRLHHLWSRVSEVLERADDAAGFAAGRALAEFRRPLNDFISLFLGDVFTYLAQRGRGHEPGPIPLRILSALEEAANAQFRQGGEPIIVLSHSMGGQIVYDLVTHFLPALQDAARYKGIRIDFWCATASQVALFEEMKLLLASRDEFGGDRTEKLVPPPDLAYLGGWWNVWDHNDFISYTAKQIFAGVDDEPFNAGTFIPEAHGGYLERPSFYRRFAAKLQAARKAGWRREL